MAPYMDFEWPCSTPDGGMSTCIDEFFLPKIEPNGAEFADRVALNDDDAKVKRWFISEVEKLGCKVTVRILGPLNPIFAHSLTNLFSCIK